MTVDPGSRGWMGHTHLPVAGAAGGNGIVTVRDEGTGLPSRTAINFTGAGVTATDNPTTGATDVTVPGGGSGSPSGTVVSETTFGQAANAGSSASYSRGDHTHGTPASPASSAPTFLSSAKWGVD